MGRIVLDAVSNFVRGTADAAVGTDDTTVSVADASIFPDPSTDGEFNVVIWDVNNFPRPDQDGDVEILRVTERDTTDDELTVVRGQETTSATAHPEGSAIHLSPTAKMFSDIESTFGDFWDADTEELTADVNNTNTTTTALQADELTKSPLFTEGFGLLSDWPEGEAIQLYKAEQSESPRRFVRNLVQYTTDVSDAKNILTSTGTDTLFVQVRGVEVIDGEIVGNTQFLDLVRAHRVIGQATVIDADPNENADGRSYSQVDDNLELSMESGNYHIIVKASHGVIRL